ncbi:MAG: AI-2E family transporter [Elusimicrobia bacterium]|nr:AI-2E family transporter [Elusimicrobiota bacterium]
MRTHAANDLRSAPGRESSRYFLIGACLVLVFMGARIFAPFLGALLASASVALLLAPVYKFLAARAPRHPTAVAAALTALVSLLVAVPLFLGGWMLLREAAEAYPAARAWLEGLSAPGALALDPSPRWAGLFDAARGYVAALKIDPRALVLENLDQVSSWAGMFARTLAKNAAFVFLNLAVFMASLFLFLRDGPRMVRSVAELIPLPDEKKEHLLARVRDVLLAVVNGIFVVALLQGTLAWAGLALFRVPFAILLGALCVMLSPIPFVGSALVWVPVVIYTLLSGAAAKAAALTLWFALVVGLSDNVVRPILLGTQMKLPIPLVFIGVIGAMKAFGIAGLFIGPLVIALSIGFLDIIREGSLKEERGA